MEGWLQKAQGSLRRNFGSKGLLSRWDRRWFVLPDGATHLIYYKSEVRRRVPPAFVR